MTARVAAPDENAEPVRIVLERFTLDHALSFCQTLRAAGRPQPPVLIDLRGNPGGQLAVLQTLIGMFLDGPLNLGTLESRQGGQALQVRPQTFQYRGPVLVWVDGGSRSMAEIFAYSLQQVGRGVVVGQATLGKVLVSRLYPLAPGLDVQVPVADFRDVQGLSLEGRGVAPDVLGDAKDGEVVRRALTLARSARLLAPSVPSLSTADAVDDSAQLLSAEAMKWISKLGASLIPEKGVSTRLIQGEVSKQQGATLFEGRFWLTQLTDGQWTMGETLQSGAGEIEYRYGRDLSGFWTQHSTTGFQRRLPHERALYPPIPLMPATAAEARRNFSTALREAMSAEAEPDVGRLIETLDGREQVVRIDQGSGVLLQRGAMTYSDFAAQDGALLPTRIRVRDVPASSAGLAQEAGAVDSLYEVKAVSYGGEIASSLHGPEQNCFTTP